MTDIADRMSVTLKQPDKERGKPGFWAVFHGNAETITRDILAFFKWSGPEVESLSLFELSTKAQQAMSGMTVVATTLGATPVSETPAAAPQPAPAAEAKAEEADMTWLHEKIKGAENIKALKIVYATHKDHMADGTEARRLYQETGKALKAAGKLD